MVQMACQLAYDTYLRNPSNPLMSYKNFENNYYAEMMREADERFQNSHEGA